MIKAVIHAATVFISSSAFFCLPAYGQDTGKIALNFRDADIRQVVNAISDYTGKPMVVDPKIKGKITIFSRDPLDKSVVFDIFLSALRVNGFTAVEHGGYLKIIAEGEGKQSANPVLEGAPETAAGENMVTHVYKLKNERAAEIAAAVKPLVSASGAAQAFDGANILLLADFAANADKIIQIINILDKGPEGEVSMLKLERLSPSEFISLYEAVYVRKASAQDAAPAQQGVKSGGGHGFSRFTLIPDVRTGSVIVRHDDPETMEKIRSFAEKVDIPSVKRDIIRVIKLNHADVKNVSGILNNLIAANQPSQGAAVRQTDDYFKIGAHPDEHTGSIVVSAPEYVRNSFATVVEGLDRPRPQVFVEALIAEITTDRVAELGVQWQSLRGLDANRAPTITAVGGVNLGGTGQTIQDVTSSATFGAGLNIGVISGTITMPDGTVVPNLLALAHALETNSNANILSTPTILSLDNEQAKIVVGQNVPFVTGAYAGQSSSGGSSVSPFQTLERKDIGLTLKIRPRIGADDKVRLEIYQEVSSLLPVTVQTGAADVVTNKRSLETNVVVDNDSTVVLGGLIQENISVNDSRVPLLGSIPLIGELFKYESRTRIKTNLMVFIRPRIIREMREMEAISSRGYDYIDREGETVRLAPSLILPDYDKPDVKRLFPMMKKEAPPPPPSPKLPAIPVRPVEEAAPTSGVE